MKRREFLACLAATLGAPAMAWSNELARTTRIDDWDTAHDRVFLGGNVWANPMEDWRIDGGWAACQTSGSRRNIQSLVYRLGDATKPFTMSVDVHRPGDSKASGGAGFRIGVKADIDDYRAACFAANGYRAGVMGSDSLVIAQKTQQLAKPLPAHVALILVGQAQGEQTRLTLTALDGKTGRSLGSMTHVLDCQMLEGNISLESQFTGPARRAKSPGYRFRDWRVSGDAFSDHPERAFGPIMWSMYSLSDNRSDEGFVMKLTALLAPLGEKDNKSVALDVKRDGAWERVGLADLDTDAWTASFRVPNWDATKAVSYRVVYVEARGENSIAVTRHEWSGTIRANPQGRPLRIGALTCQNAVGFPYQPVADNLVKLDPDLLFFSGDQLYEAHGGFGVIRDDADPAILNYLRKYYMFGWAFREAMANAPTIVLPDDHDVFHGNIWGEAGKPFDKASNSTSSSGGYRQPAKMVNVVHKTSCSHHPDFADPTPVKQDISVYFGDMVYGGVGFAILADRQWKSEPEKSGNQSKRVDHVTDPKFDTTTFDKEGLVLLGERQERFLERWASDWRGHTMKVVLSQTIFAGAATHHGGYGGYLVADLDSGSWPQTPRNRAIDLIRPAMPLHICGDQHLASAVQ
ncbi:MAG: alkaline phosphatase D family protein, partial [Phycisphaeraceae bacterium]